MSFLKNQNEQRRLYLQLKGFQSNTYLEVAAELVAIPSFKLPEQAIMEADVADLQMPERLRLGNRLERFFSFIIQQSTRYELIAENIQINENKITLGELDFLIYDTDKQEVLHIELAGKLYLYDPNITEELDRWIGPNRKDSLVRKTATLKQKQFPILFNSATKSILKDFNLESKNIRQRVSYKTRLFLPFATKNDIPGKVNPCNIKGYYVSLNEFLSNSFSDYSYFIPLKQDWIVDPKYGEVWHSHAKILRNLEISLLEKMSPMIWVKKPNHTFETIFVVWW